MRYYISLLLFSLFALTFTSCNTDDLEKDIDALKDRVTNMEAQVQQLNDEMNIIRVLLDGNKTITDYTIDGDTYTLTLSNGEKLTLTPGVVGENFPSIGIGENGNWVIGGKDTGLRAESEDGKDATITPKFKIEPNAADGGKKYWYVSYDEGATWTVLANGLAEGNNTNTNPISNAEVVGDNFKVHFNGQDYFIPIVKGLDCAINLPGGMMGGVWTVAGGGESSFTVKVNLAEGDLVRVKAPVDWNAKLLNNVAGSKEVTVTVTPPTTASECVIVVEVTHGVNTATDQIKAKTTSESYWADYQSGFDILIGDVSINKFDNPDARLVQSGETISGKGVYFIAEGATVTWTGNTSHLILVSEKKKNDYSSKVVGNGILSLGNEASGIGLLCKGIHFSPTGLSGAYWVNAAGNEISRLYLDHCKVELMQGKAFSYFNNVAFGIGDLLIESCRIAVPAAAASANVINFLNVNVGTYGSVKVRNNVFSCSTSGQSVLLIGLMGSGAVASVNIENNTLINVLTNHGTNSGFLRIKAKEGWTMKNNLVWYDTDCQQNTGGTSAMLATFMTGADAFNGANFTNNGLFSAVPGGTQTIWRMFRTAPAGFVNDDLTPETVSPFVDGTLVATEGKYTLKPEYQGIGATIE